MTRILLRCLTFTALIALPACGADDTTGRRIVLHTRIASDAQPGVPFTPSSGWSITLRQALLATGPLYYFDGHPAVVQRRGPGWQRWLARLAPVGTAHAHPGHYAAGRAKGQMLLPFSADLLAAPTALPDGDGITGLFRSGTVTLAAPSAGPALAQLQGHVAVAAGTASKDGKTIHFVFNADLADVTRTAKDGQITGCALPETDVQSDGTVTVTVKPRVWFNLVDFAELAPGTAEAPTVVPRESTAQIAFALGLGQLSAYEFSFTAAAP